MKKMSIVFAALVLIAVGLFMDTISTNHKAYAYWGEGGSTEYVTYGNGSSQTVTLDRAEYQKLINDFAAVTEELGTYKALEIFWATEILTPAPAPCTSSCAGRNLQIM
ncbi:hypothetical protein A2482_03105 [Candidatus Falkowbacteria bacterium RIFOXYC2_FULL_48_21]|uniref:Uncharacterized protein n=1 Tax=Candidatus Falkowbacteria bacterium RIFOXYC2_FULL_48_21 TaxID=1798005 RepID=A0A1F5T9E9_9BACT|nr:MAG: hypothetical protein A2482_03105 [Candidatus Falkowbacteria bacterium RIFOXYC2_FULL_48_21]